jgi:hypothetical protein
MSAMETPLSVGLRQFDNMFLDEMITQMFSLTRLDYARNWSISGVSNACPSVRLLEFLIDLLTTSHTVQLWVENDAMPLIIEELLVSETLGHLKTGLSYLYMEFSIWYSSAQRQDPREENDRKMDAKLRCYDHLHETFALPLLLPVVSSFSESARYDAIVNFRHDPGDADFIYRILSFSTKNI